MPVFRFRLAPGRARGSAADAQLAPPILGLLGLAPALVEPDDSRGGLGQAGPVRGRNVCLAGLHPLVAGDNQGLRLVVLLQAREAGARKLRAWNVPQWSGCLASKTARDSR